MTKTFRFIGMVLVAMLMSVGFAACSSDDDDEEGAIPTATEMIGTTWAGTSAMNYGITVYVEDASKCVVTVTKPNSSTVYDQDECTYTYNAGTGTFSCNYDDGITGKVSGNKMTVTDSYGTYTLTKSETTTTSIVGTTWSGKNSSMGYTVTVYIKSSTKCEVTVSGSKEECSYTYSESTSKFVCQHSTGTITGTISGSKMTVKDSYGTYTLTKQ